MNNYPFIGRKTELEKLEELLDKKTASLVAITGRRRIGKSRLIEEFAHKKNFYQFTGLPPTQQTSAQSQRDEFAKQFAKQFDFPGLKAEDWSDLFLVLAKQTANKQTIILFDEISWMGSKDPDFLGKLKTAWDLHFKKNSKLILILCGSVSSWIEKNILANTGFLGRITLKIHLDEFSLSESHLLLQKLGFNGSDIEKFMLLSVTGGVPWYIELISPKLSAEKNIHNLCFTKDGILVDEFKNIFHDLFEKRGEFYQSIVKTIEKKPLEYSEISTEIQYASGGPLTEYLNELILSGFISRDFSWNIKSTKMSKLSRYRIKDNYLRFYLKYILPRLTKIKNDQIEKTYFTDLPAIESVLGLQFENLVLSNKKFLWRLLKINPEEIICDNPYFQKQTTKHQGCQIDYLIQTKHQRLYVCEIKFSLKEISATVIQEVQEKIKRLSHPKGFSCIPVLIHVNGVTADLKDKDYFANIIDLSLLF